MEPKVKEVEGYESSIEDMMKDENFIKYLYRDFKKQANIKSCRDNIENMMSDMKKLPEKVFISKYGRPQRIFAKMKWKLYKVKNDIIDCDKCMTYHRYNAECIELKRRVR